MIRHIEHQDRHTQWYKNRYYLYSMILSTRIPDDSILIIPEEITMKLPIYNQQESQWILLHITTRHSSRRTIPLPRTARH